MQQKLLAVVVIVIIVAVTAAAYQLNPKPPAPIKEIKIGLVAPMSLSAGQDMYRAAQMAVVEINDAGGVYLSEWNKKVNITILLADTIGDAPNNAVAEVTRAVETDHVDLLIGGYGTAGTLADERIAVDDRVPFIITGVSNPLVTTRGPQGDNSVFGANATERISDADGMRYIFQYCTTTFQYAKTAVDYCVAEMKPLVAADRNFSLAIIWRSNDFGQSVEQATKFWIQNESLPINLVADRDYEMTTDDYQTDLAAIAAASPDAVLVVDNPEQTAKIISHGWNDVGLKTVYLAVENNPDAALNDSLGAVGDGQLLAIAFDPSSDLQAVQAFALKFNQTYGLMPGMLGANTYDAFYIAKDAIERAGTTDSIHVRSALESTNMTQSLILTQAGNIQFSAGANYHEIDALPFIEQLYWNATTNELKSRIVWPATYQAPST